MDKSDQKRERRFSQEQYDMLKRCSDAKDMMEWKLILEQRLDPRLRGDKGARRGVVRLIIDK